MFRSATNRRTVVFEREIGKKFKIGAQFPNIGKSLTLFGRTRFFSAAAALDITSVIPAYNIIANSIQCYPAVDF